VKKPSVLLTNDDGYQAEGLKALAEELREFAHVAIVAPSWERSGSAQSLTLRQPIVCHKIAENQWAVDGTPADCVIVALHKLLPEQPDLVISDWNMEPMTGYDLLREMRADPGLDQTPFIMVTAESKTDNVIAARKAGASNYIVKPFNAQTLKAKIEAVFTADEEAAAG